MRIETIRIEGEHRDDANKTERLHEVELGSGVDLDVHIIDGAVFNLVQLQMVHGSILKSDVVETDIETLVDPNEMGPRTVIVKVLLHSQQKDDPPMVTSAVDLSAASDL